MPQDAAEHDVNVGVLENEGFETGCFGAFCGTCVMWVGPHRDSEGEAEGDARRHKEAVWQQLQAATGHLAVARFDQHEFEIVKDMVQEEPGTVPDFGPYFARCDDCGGLVSLGRQTDEEASKDAQQHRAAFESLLAAPPT